MKVYAKIFFQLLFDEKRNYYNRVISFRYTTGENIFENESSNHNSRFSICTFLLAPMLSTASADTTPSKTKVSGVGVFEHEHEGTPHTHYFVFSITSGSSKTSPQGHFSLVCKHDGQIETIIFSTKINSLNVEVVQGGLKAVFTGSALVKMGGADWEKGWTFVVTAYDFGKGSDLIGVTLITPQG